jgi:hypothetical protein
MRGLSAKSDGLPTERCCARSRGNSILISTRPGAAVVERVVHRRAGEAAAWAM